MPVVRIEVPDHVAAVAAYVKSAWHVPLPKVYGAMLAVSMRDDTLEQYAELLADAVAKDAPRQLLEKKRRVRAGSV